MRPRGPMNLREEIIANYVSTSPGIHRVCTDHDVQSFIQAYKWHLREWLPSDLDARWLDIGCGQGQVMSLAREVGFKRILGVDLSDEMLASCQARGLDVRKEDAMAFIKGALPESFGVVSAFDFLEHLAKADVLSLLRQIRRVVTPGGTVLIKVPNGGSPWVGDIFFSDLTHESMWTPASLAQLSQLAGFTDIQLREVGPVPHGLVSIMRFLLWRPVRLLRRCLNAIETGSAGPNVTTRVMLAKLIR
jgi:SAM-dependent methyltransferase